MSKTRDKEFEELKGGVLSHLVKDSFTRPRERLKGVLGQGMVVSLENFLYEVLSYIKENELIRFYPAPSFVFEEWSKRKCSKPLLRTVAGERRTSGSRSGKDGGAYSQVPVIHLTGKWLAGYGFTAGKKVLIYPSRNQLIIKESASCVEANVLPMGGESNV